MAEKVVARLVILVLFNIAAVVGLLVAVDGDAGTGKRVVAAIVAAMFVVMSVQSVRATERHRLRAGREWLSEDGRTYVRLDRLELVEAFTNGGAGTYVRFIDLDGRGLNFAASELQRNPMLHRIVLDAIHGNEQRGRTIFESPTARRRFVEETEPYEDGAASDTHR